MTVDKPSFHSTAAEYRYSQTETTEELGTSTFDWDSDRLFSPGSIYTSPQRFCPSFC